MAKQTINLGVAPDGAGGDSVRSGFTKTNSNFTELYNKLGDGNVLPVSKGGTGATTAATARKELGLGTAATRDVGESAGNLMEVGAGGWMWRSGVTSYISGYPPTTSESVSQVYRRGSVDNGVRSYSASIHFAAFDTWGRVRVDHSLASVWVQGGASSIGSGWTVELFHTRNTIVDSNGFIKKSSPIIKLLSTSLSTNEDPHFTDNKPTLTKQSTGVYTITNTHGLRLGDGWYIEQPRDRNGELYHNVEWDQDIEYAPEDGVVEENDPTVTLTIRTFERVWNKDTGLWENGNPVDIKEGRWIDLRLNEIRQPDPIIEEEDNSNEDI